MVKTPHSPEGPPYEQGYISLTNDIRPYGLTITLAKPCSLSKNTHAFMHACIQVCVYTYRPRCTHTHISMYYAHYMYIYLCIHIDIQRWTLYNLEIEPSSKSFGPALSGQAARKVQGSYLARGGFSHAGGQTQYKPP